VQQQHRLEPGEQRVGDEGDVAGDRAQAQRQHAAHAEGRQHQTGREITERIDFAHRQGSRRVRP
jgi:hypothetical protein